MRPGDLVSYNNNEYLVSWVGRHEVFLKNSSGMIRVPANARFD